MMESESDSQYRSSEEAKAAEELEAPQEIQTRKVKISLIRHGQSVHNVAEPAYFAGRSREHDTGLTEQGFQTAAEIAEELKGDKIDVIIHSDLLRARETAEAIAKRLGYEIELVEMAGLEEVDVGNFAGKTREQIYTEGKDEEKTALDDFATGDVTKINFPGGESYETASARAKTALDQIINEYGDRARIAIVAHGNVNKVILSLLFPDQIGFVNQLRLGYNQFLEFDMIQAQDGSPDFQNLTIVGEPEKKDKGLI